MIQTFRCVRARHLLLFILALAMPSAGFSDVSEAQIERVKQSIKALDKWLKDANTEKSGLTRRLRNVEKAIGKHSLEIKTLSKQSSQINARLAELNQRKKKQEAALKQQAAQLEQQLKAIYLQGTQPAIKLLLDAEDPQNISRDIRYFDYLNQASNEQIEAFKNTLNALDQTKNQLIGQRVKLTETTKALKAQRQKLEGESAKRKQVLASLNKEINSKSQELEKLQADQKRLEKLLKEVEQAIADLPIPQESGPFSKQKSKLRWPTRGKVVQRFGSRLAQGKLKSQGIRIAVKDDSPVAAVHYGQVVFSDWLRGFGLLLILDHGDGYMSLYGNNKSLLKDAGEWVSAGDLIAYSGNSGGQASSSLYFEIRRKGTPQNPLKWLSK